VILSGLDDARAVEALSAALGSPWDVTGAAHVEGRTLVRVEGFAAQTAHRGPALARLLAPFGAAEIAEGEASATLWRGVRDVAAFHHRPGAVWRVSVKPSDGPRLVSALKAAGEFAALYDWGGGLVWLLTPEAGDAGAALIRAETRERSGHATLVRASAATRAAVEPFEPAAPGVAALEARLRAAFDPKSILNPGRMRG